MKKLSAVVILSFVASCGPVTFEPAKPKPSPGIDAHAAAERLSAAIQLPTISDPPQFKSEPFTALHTLLEQSFPRVHATLQREIINQHSLLYVWPGQKQAENSPPIILLGHLDVVPVAPEQLAKWTHPPYSGALVDGKIWGRGAQDDKLSVLGILEAVELLLAEGFSPARTLILAFGHDEEVDGLEGARKMATLLESRFGKQNAWFVLDEGMTITEGMAPGVKPAVAFIGTAEKGYLSLELTATGPAGHSSVPADNTSVMVLSKALVALSENPFDERLEEPSSTMVEMLGPYTEGWFTRRGMQNQWLLGGAVKSAFASAPESAAMIKTTMVPTIIKAGIKDNVVPAEAKAIVNFRLLPGDTIESVVAHVKETLEDEELPVTVRSLPGGNNPTPVSSTDSDSYKLLSETIRDVFPDVIIAPSLMVGGTDAKHYVALSENIYRFLPQRLDGKGLGQIHGVDEHISVKNYVEIIHFYHALMRRSLAQ